MLNFFDLKNTLGILFFLVLSFVLNISCSSSEETQSKKQETDSVYVFDEIPPEDLFILESPAQQSIDVYVVQIGAFSTFKHAKEFADQSWLKLNKEIKVEFKEDKNLYVVWIYPPFENKISADNCRKEIQVGDAFKDAWIVTIASKK